ncbi:MAG TPA: phosphatidylcholine synthase [Vicinamibacteria bacterium]|nr:phosphatidylcholine synthase [Vicinamibacteria bacterium]
MQGAAWAVHLLTASGVVLAFLATAECVAAVPDPRRVFLWLALAVAVDAVDGPLARAVDVKRRLPGVQGRTIDDIVDYLTFTFIPLLLCWRLGWVPGALWVMPALVASLLGFASTGAKQEEDGFFGGFPSYWNVFAFYAGIWAQHASPLAPGLAALLLAGLTVAPVRFLYPNLAPAPWRGPLIAGAWAWAVLLALMLRDYPASTRGLVALSLVYPAFYVVLSVALDVRGRRRAARGLVTP